MKKNNLTTRLIAAMLFGLILFYAGESHAQSNFTNKLPSGLSAGSNVIFKKVNESDVEEKNYLLPAVEVIGLNLTLGAVNNYIFDQNFAKISFGSIKDNFKTGFAWDEDNYLMNQFFHPFHGANYFNSARSNGLSFWESVPYTLGGSLMWEYFMENEPPSYNDLINTSVSGITLGEISYRVSNLIIDESTGGFERFLREFSSTLINPMQGFNRLIKGKMWRPGKASKTPDYTLTLSTGVHNVFFSNRINNSKSYFTLRANLIYGEKFSVSSHKQPFDYFSLHTEFNFAEGDDIQGIFASGVLWDGKIKLFENSKNIIGLYKEIDILTNVIYKLAAASFTGQIINQNPFSSSLMLETSLSISSILIGATNSRYASAEGKDYNLGPGLSGKLGAALFIANFGEIYGNYKRYWIHTLSGAEGEEFVGLLMTGINYHLFEKTALGLEFLLYERYGEYNYYPDYSNSNTAVRFYVKQSIK
ncbi:MAG: DUF3943 domain-containing protein [Melioribacteraceae bacterium]|nr:DUF3943 domain-containing protein [Melioribacteraceae bacterium]MCF8354125.1 DUF3943 domain-containing protein [Melioribacteraceae bacterium]MCF8393352.1 DUF3943 domain-containing protein [Melioribacteraceae bacterium]MCF8418917.1 DUF3943 domain-containing protein [Melioribacteraceae bacterium]